MKPVYDKPTYMYPPNYRDYKTYLYGVQYAQGWNDAMRFIFGERCFDDSEIAERTGSRHRQRTE